MEKIYGITMRATIAVTALSCGYCMIPQMILMVNSFDFSLTIITIVTLLIKATMAIYAGTDMLH